MIKISIDEAAAFDMLSILEIKGKYDSLVQEIEDQLGYDKTEEVLSSPEYQNLLEANKQVFRYIDELNAENDMSAIAVHKANMQRYHYKQQLQQRYFKSNLTEKKI